MSPERSEPKTDPGAPSIREGQTAGRCARVVALHVHRHVVELLLETQNHQVAVSVPVDQATAHALRHLHALRSCPHAPSPRPAPQVSLLLRAIASLDGASPTIVVRGGDEPAFWLRVGRGRSHRELDLDVVDAVNLLGSGRLRVELVDTQEPNWDAALQDLLDDRHHDPSPHQDEERG